jgi:hypothetical protein
VTDLFGGKSLESSWVVREVFGRSDIDPADADSDTGLPELASGSGGDDKLVFERRARLRFGGERLRVRRKEKLNHG